MNRSLTKEQKLRYFTDPEFHARVEVVARALWSVDSHYPYERLIPETTEDLIAYAIAAVEALEALEDTQAQRYQTLRNTATKACEAEFTSERLAAMGELRALLGKARSPTTEDECGYVDR